MLSPSYIILKKFKDYRANSVDLDEVAHYEPPHQDLRCLQIQLFASLVLKELKLLKELKPLTQEQHHCVHWKALDGPGWCVPHW